LGRAATPLPSPGRVVQALQSVPPLMWSLLAPHQLPVLQ
jgi:hypothetical protein